MVKGANGTKMLIAHINLVVAMYVLHNHQHGIKTHSLRVFLFLSFFSSAVHLLLLGKAWIHHCCPTRPGRTATT